MCLRSQKPSVLLPVLFWNSLPQSPHKLNILIPARNAPEAQNGVFSTSFVSWRNNHCFSTDLTSIQRYHTHIFRVTTVARSISLQHSSGFRTLIWTHVHRYSCWNIINMCEHCETNDLDITCRHTHINAHLLKHSFQLHHKFSMN